MAIDQKSIKLTSARTNLELAARKIQEAIDLTDKSTFTDEEVRQLRVIRGEISSAHYKLNRMR